MMSNNETNPLDRHLEKILVAAGFLGASQTLCDKMHEQGWRAAERAHGLAEKKGGAA